MNAYDEARGTPHDWDYYIGPSGNRAGYDDLSGDLDALTLHFAAAAGDARGSCAGSPEPFGWLDSHRPLSQMIARYYGADPSGPAQYRATRAQCIAEMIGLDPSDPATFGEKIGPMIFELAQPYFFAQNGGSTVLIPAWERRLRECSQRAGELFAAWLATQSGIHRLA